MRSFRSLPLLVLFALPCSAQQPLIFDAPVVVADADSRFVKTLDLDGDGWMDAIGWWKVSSTHLRLNGWINDGAGRLVERWSRLNPYPSQTQTDPHDGTAIADLDGDGDDDFVLSLGYMVEVWLSNGASEPTLAISHPALTVRGVAIADFDLDGDLEIAYALNDTLEIRAPDLVNGLLLPVSQISAGTVLDGRLVAAELTGDDRPDLMIKGALIFPVVGGQLQPPVIYNLPWANDGASLRPDVGDIDGDGDLDVVTFRVPTSGTEPARYRVLRRTGPATFVAEPSQLGGPARRLFDIDGDGDLDGTCCGGGGGGTPPQNIALSSFRLAWNDGTGNFAPSIDIPSVGSTAIAGVEDLDHDGHLDLVGGRCVYYSQDGPITGWHARAVGTRIQNEQTLCDYDQDGDPDVELSVSGVRANLGNGSEVPRANVLPAALPGMPRVGFGAPGDWDGDGDVDLLVTLGTQLAPLGLELLRNVGCGAFESAGVVAYAYGLAGYPLASEDSLAADLDGDGDLDLVLRTRSELGGTGPLWISSSWWRNEGSGGFVLVERFANKLLLQVADLNGDLKPDLLAVPAQKPAGYTAFVLHWAAGLGGGTFGPWTLIPDTGSRPFPPGDQVCVADIDADGDLDLVLADHYTDSDTSGRVNLNDGFGHFTQASQPDVPLAFGGTMPGAAAVADLDGDGQLDLVFGASKLAANSALIFLRKSDNSDWEPPIQQIVFSRIGTTNYWNSWITIRDPDGDRDVDLITDHCISNLLYAQPDSGSRLQVEADSVAGMGAIVPTLGAVGPFRVGTTDTLRLRGARPGANGTLSSHYVGSGAAPFGGMTALSRLAQIESFVVSGSASDPAGSGSWSKVWTVPASDAGRTRVYTVSIEDSDAPGGRALANRLVLAFGP